MGIIENRVFHTKNLIKSFLLKVYQFSPPLLVTYMITVIVDSSYKEWNVSTFYSWFIAIQQHTDEWFVLRHYFLRTPPPPSGFWSSVGFKIGVVTCFFFFWGGGDTRYMYTRVRYGGKETPHAIHTPIWKIRLKHSTAEIQLIQQFWLQLDIVS